ncbi:MAG: ribonuclease inhibitor [Hymenobacter sp.]|nr:MAG: ribonuclease inhibitor [Hymenobacter sp.]
MTIDLQQTCTPAELHALLQERLEFPAWYGGNWDAFWDAITGLVEMPSEVRLVGWQNLAAAYPHDIAILRELAAEYTQPGRCLVLAG